MFSPVPSPPAGKTRFLATVLTFGLVFGFLGSLRAQTASQEYAQGVAAYNRGDVDGAKQKLQLALAVDANFRPASALLTRIAAEKHQPAAAGFNAKTLERTVIPVEFSNTTLDSALEYIRQKVAEQSGNKVMINFAVNVPPEMANRKITLKMDNVPVLEVLRYMGELAGVKFEKQQYAIAVTPAGDSAATTNANPAPAKKPGS